MLDIVKGDITLEESDIIVNAANSTLLGGGGVDGAIHKAAGKELLEECRSLNGCKTGEAKITKAYGLKSKYIIHTVGPIWRGGNKNEDKYLKDCFINSLMLAKKYKAKSISFPAISCGIYGYPKELASDECIKAIFDFIHRNIYLIDIKIICYDKITENIFKKSYNLIIKNL